MKYFPGARIMCLALTWLACGRPAQVQAQTATRITALTPNGTLAWTNATPEHLYRVESSPTAQYGWDKLGAVLTSTAPAMTVAVAVTNSAQFFRVVDIGSCSTNYGGLTFAQAVDLGGYCSDIPASLTTLTRSGCSNAWFRVRANECQLGTFQVANLKLAITLTPPPGLDYDLNFYNPDGSFRGASVNGGSTPENFTFNITDTDTLFNITNQSFEIWIQILRYTGTGCGNWTLSVKVGG